jgi:hypothetical protein
MELFAALRRNIAIGAFGGTVRYANGFRGLEQPRTAVSASFPNHPNDRGMFQQMKTAAFNIVRFWRQAWIYALVVTSLCILIPSSVPAQGVQTVLHARARVFPDVGPGASKIERDPASGRYLVLAKPESVIAVYSAEGKRIGQIPSEKTGPAAQLKYAVDFDLDSKGRLFVADRGGNCIKIYSPEGALESSVFVNAPMSVVALANKQFAVVTLRMDHLVRVMDEHGKLVRTFGSVNDAIGAKTETGTETEPAGYAAGYNADYAAHANETFAMNIGKLYSDESGHIFFAFTALDDPMFRKYDPYGYSAFESVVPAESLIPDIDRGDAHVQLGANVSGMAGIGNFFSFGTMYSVGGTAGFTVRGGNGGGGGHRGGGGGSAGASGSGSGGSGSGGGSGNSRFSSSGYSSSDTGGYDTNATGLFSASADSTGVSGTDGTLSFNSANASFSSEGADSGALFGVGGMGGMYGASGSNLLMVAPGLAGTNDPAALLGVFGPRGVGGFGGGPGEPGGGFHGGFGGPGGPGGESHGVPGASEAYIPGPPPTGTNIAASGATTSSTTPPKPGGAAVTPSGHSYGEGHGDYSGHGYGHGLDMHAVAAVVKFNQVEADHRPKPVIHAIATDPDTQEVWVTIGDVLLHFDSAGNRESSYLITTNTGAPISPVGILVEADRLLLVSDPNGIYDFARPDQSEQAPRRSMAVQANPAPSKTSTASGFVAAKPATAPGTPSQIPSTQQ